MYKEIKQSSLKAVYENDSSFRSSLDEAFNDGLSYTQALELAVTNLSLAKEKQQNDAIGIAVRFGGFELAHHKSWVIDQMVRSLSGNDYEKVVKEARSGEDGDNSYSWDEGIAP